MLVEFDQPLGVDVCRQSALLGDLAIGAERGGSMANDELMHPVGDDPAWSESYYFNFVDPKTGIGMFTRMGFRPGNGWADALHAVYLGGERVAFTYGRRDIGKDLSQFDGDLKVGGLRIICEEPFKRWRIDYDGPAQDIADGAILMTRSRERPEGWHTPARLAMSLTFDTLTEPHYAANGAHGHFEQSGHVSGSLTIGQDQRAFDGFGVRDKSWGPRNWSGSSSNASTAPSNPSRNDAPNPFVFWFSMNFGAETSMGGSCGRSADGVMRGQGWIQDGETYGALRDIVVETRFRPGSILHEAVTLTARTEAGRAIRIEGEVTGMCPTKIPFPGGATFVNEGLGRFTMDGRVGFGIAEQWHNVTE